VDRRTRILFLLVLVAVVALAGVGAIVLGSTSLRDPDAPAGATSLDGVIIGVQAEGLDRVAGFTLRTADGASVAFVIGVLDNGAEFPPGHLVEHQATAQPVRVWYRVEGADKVAVRLEDAPS
jgi:hypothetical protein